MSTSVAFSPDGKTLAAGYTVGSASAAAAAWCSGTRRGHAAGGRAAARARGRRRERGLQPRRPAPWPRATATAASAAADVRRRGAVGRGAAGAAPADEPLPVAEGDVASVAFSPDGKTLAAVYDGGGVGGGVVLWDAARRDAAAGRAAARGRGRRLRAWPSAPTARPSPRVRRSARSAAGWCSGTRRGAAARGRRRCPWPRAASERGLQPRRQDPRRGLRRRRRPRRRRGALGRGAARAAAARAAARGTRAASASVAFSPDGKTLAAGYAAPRRRPTAAAWCSGTRCGARGWR